MIFAVIYAIFIYRATAFPAVNESVATEVPKQEVMTTTTGSTLPINEEIVKNLTNALNMTGLTVEQRDFFTNLLGTLGSSWGTQ